ncbi:MAG TPA: M1 family metallopeptidase, partial [Anaeromyxobacter sp.]|nr:M1 family metallopeptidase [Anaeromyxobacter sp.]
MAMSPGTRCARLAAALALGCASRSPAPPAGAPSDASLDLRLPDGVVPTHYTIHFDLDPAHDRFRGAAAIELELGAPTRVVWLHARDLHVTSCGFETPDGARGAAGFEQVSPRGLAKVTLPRALGSGRATLRIGWDAAFGDREQVGIFRWRAGEDTYVLAEFLSVDARRAFPAFDEPRFKAPFDVSVTIPADHVAVANEAVADEVVLSGGRKRVRFASTRPLPAYLVFVGAGPFDVVERPLPPNEVRSWTLPVRGLAPRGRGRELGFGLEAAAALLTDLERWFGTPYPYRKLDHVSAGAYPGAKENAAAILYGDVPFLEEPGQADEERRRTAAMYAAHELAHQWVGASVTAPTTRDAWLNESFAHFLGYAIADRYRPSWGLVDDRLVALERAMRLDGLASARAIRPATEVASFDELETWAVYDKGAAVVAMFERWMGPERFRSALGEYVRAHADASGSAEDLFASLSRAAGTDVAVPLRDFLERPGIPLITARVACEARSTRAILAQRRYGPRGADAPGGAWHVPVCARFELGGVTSERCALVPPDGTVLELPGCPDWFLPDAGGTGYFRWALDARSGARLRAVGLSRLTAEERLSVAHNAWAAQRAGAVPYADAMDLLAALAGDRSAALAAVAMEAIRHGRDHLLDPADRPLATKTALRLFRPLLRGSGLDAPVGEEEPARRRRVELVRFLVNVARDPDLRREAARRGAAYAGVADGRFHGEAVPADLAATALRVALEEQGPALYDALLPRLASVRGSEREHLVEALALADAPALGARPAALWRDARLAPVERMFPALLDYDPGV